MLFLVFARSNNYKTDQKQKRLSASADSRCCLYLAVMHIVDDSVKILISIYHSHLKVASQPTLLLHEPNVLSYTETWFSNQTWVPYPEKLNTKTAESR